ncbi:hypothetical protein AG1IA_07446 [Rhizoctonia solani AG-1 IA]|uniref:Uncharacterized protein n=1 Tax=Thanatephorus cucumeris (strain AG1-IA) TaxID=983506 RepID=L8WK05_THACA|nr:hypothetical protein AG1IA_07446 [Rhizoctonia solani AG-1 IA]
MYGDCAVKHAIAWWLAGALNKGGRGAGMLFRSISLPSPRVQLLDDIEYVSWARLLLKTGRKALSQIGFGNHPPILRPLVMNTLGAYTSCPTQSAANPFALFGIAQFPRETCETYRNARTYSHTELGILAKRTKRSLAILKYDDPSLDTKSEKLSYTTSCESRKSGRSWFGRRRDSIKRFSNMRQDQAPRPVGTCPTLENGASGISYEPRYQSTIYAMTQPTGLSPKAPHAQLSLHPIRRVSTRNTLSFSISFPPWPSRSFFCLSVSQI